MRQRGEGRERLASGDRSEKRRKTGGGKVGKENFLKGNTVSVHRRSS